ncbi:N-carbamoyl-L-amino-acid hydrolase [Constrictibacter sp. MBR-5]|jgi:N-carbamoyl-L-amino-acid hydrolase|uniref:Zn-dependent hydrolase n=1 Tax=Constrictibacter sp. MBR-5 TaxID=3156467 RepID=UPI0033994EAB
MPKINPERLLADLRRLADFGRYKTGVHRPTFSPQDVESRAWLQQRFAEAGLNASIDGVGNVIGSSRVNGPRLLMGSHSETQPHAGWLDGAMGVIYALEVARAFAEDPACAGMGIEVASWADEESHYASMLGSHSFVGDLTDADLDAAKNRDDGTPLREALDKAGYADKPRALIDPSRYVGYVEAHIEQGDSLEATGKRIGVVTSIVGIWQYRIHFTGVQNHAGTTRMAIRKDAGVALVNLASAIYEAFPKVAAERTVWTTGRIDLDPNAPSIVPGGAKMMFQFRDADPERLLLLEKTLFDLVAAADAAGPCGVTIETVSRSEPKVMEGAFQDALEEAAKEHAPGMHVRMPSGAGHDAQILAKKLPAAMLFVPSIGGISHHYAENTSDDDLVLGCQVLADAAEKILKRAAK